MNLLHILTLLELWLRVPPNLLSRPNYFGLSAWVHMLNKLSIAYLSPISTS
jgi:hypothetical protein